MKKLHIILFLGFVLTLFSCSKNADFEEDSFYNVAVENNKKYIELIPAAISTETVGIMFYPGGLVEPEAYIPLLTPLAAKYYIIIVKMPSDLAVFSPQRGVNLIEDDLRKMKKWIIMGHSLGGTMAVRALKKNEDVFSGLVLLASYPAKADDISEFEIPVLSIHASEDGLSTPQDIEDTKNLLPADTEFYLIEGGNHSQFGSYGTQNKDGEATISSEEQKSITAAQILEFLQTKI